MSHCLFMGVLSFFLSFYFFFFFWYLTVLLYYFGTCVSVCVMMIRKKGHVKYFTRNSSPNCSNVKKNWNAKPKNWREENKNCAIIHLRHVRTTGHHSRPLVVAYNPVSIMTSNWTFPRNFKKLSRDYIGYGFVSTLTR